MTVSLYLRAPVSPTDQTLQNQQTVLTKGSQPYWNGDDQPECYRINRFYNSFHLQVAFFPHMQAGAEYGVDLNHTYASTNQIDTTGRWTHIVYRRRNLVSELFVDGTYDSADSGQPFVG